MAELGTPTNNANDAADAKGGAGGRSKDDVALDLMKFIAVTSGYGKVGSPGAGFQGNTVSKAEDYARHLLDLYSQCLAAVQQKK